MKICAICAFYRLPRANNLLPLKTYSSINSIMDFILEMHFDIKHFIEMDKSYCHCQCCISDETFITMQSEWKAAVLSISRERETTRKNIMWKSLSTMNIILSLTAQRQGNFQTCFRDQFISWKINPSICGRLFCHLRDQNLHDISEFSLSLILIKISFARVSPFKVIVNENGSFHKLFSLSTIAQQLFMIFFNHETVKKKSSVEETIKAFFAHHKSHLLVHNDNRCL